MPITDSFIEYLEWELHNETAIRFRDVEELKELWKIYRLFEARGVPVAINRERDGVAFLYHIPTAEHTRLSVKEYKDIKPLRFFCDVVDLSGSNDDAIDESELPPIEDLLGHFIIREYRLD